MKDLVKSQSEKSAAIEAAKNQPIKMVEAYTISKQAKTPYRALTNNRAHFSAWIIAAAITSGHVTMTTKGAFRKQAKGNKSLLAAIIGSTARGHWIKQGRMAKDGSLTASGLNAFSERLAGTAKGGYNTDAETVKAFAAAQKKGGACKVGETTYTLDSKVAVKA